MITITIEIDDQGAMNMKGIPSNKVVGYGIIALAGKLMDRFYSEQDRAGIVVAQAGSVPLTLGSNCGGRPPLKAV